jgi:hypothetical protein
VNIHTRIGRRVYPRTSHAGGHRFESCRPHHFLTIITITYDYVQCVETGSCVKMSTCFL